MLRINLAIAVTAVAIGLAPAADAHIVANSTSLNGHEQQGPSSNGQDLNDDLNGGGAGGHNLAASRVGPAADAFPTTNDMSLNGRIDRRVTPADAEPPVIGAVLLCPLNQHGCRRR
jgi:hypothetical protein